MTKDEESIIHEVVWQNAKQMRDTVIDAIREAIEAIKEPKELQELRLREEEKLITMLLNAKLDFVVDYVGTVAEDECNRIFNEIIFDIKDFPRKEAELEEKIKALTLEKESCNG